MIATVILHRADSADYLPNTPDDSITMRMQTATKYFQMGRFDQAAELCLQILDTDAEDISAIRLLAQIYNRKGESDGLIDMLQRAQALDPDNPLESVPLGLALQKRGRFDEARAVYRRALPSHPEPSGVYFLLAMITKYSSQNDEIADMENLYRETTEGTNNRRLLAFALGKVFDDLGEYDKAFEFFQEGNEIAFRAFGYSIEQDERAFAVTKKIFDANFFRHSAVSACTDRTPIFVTGMPRSGTTLVEQILASHPDVYGAGEIGVLRRAIEKKVPAGERKLPEDFGRLGGDELSAIADLYLEELKGLADGEARVTDKSIDNIFQLGLISVMIPNASIVICERDPRDQGLSMFKQDLREQPWGYNLASIGLNQRMFRDLLEHWTRLMPGRIYRLRYESLVADPEAHIRNLLEHCGLPFAESCLAFHQTDRVVQTASNTQVRKPIYKDSVGRWKNYERHLEPLVTALGCDGGLKSETRPGSYIDDDNNGV